MILFVGENVGKPEACHVLGRDMKMSIRLEKGLAVPRDSKHGLSEDTTNLCLELLRKTCIHKSVYRRAQSKTA